MGTVETAYNGELQQSCDSVAMQYKGKGIIESSYIAKGDG